MSVILETKQLCKFYGAGENQVKAVNQVDIQIEQGEFVAIVGKSGSGKSTLLHMKFRDIDEAILDGVKEKLLEGFRNEEEFGYMAGYEPWEKLIFDR